MKREYGILPSLKQCNIVEREFQSHSPELIQVLLNISYVTLSKSLNLSGPQFLYLQNENNNILFLEF